VASNPSPGEEGLWGWWEEIYLGGGGDMGK
jgi:hypothetical protein